MWLFASKTKLRERHDELRIMSRVIKLNILMGMSDEWWSAPRCQNANTARRTTIVICMYTAAACDISLR